MTIKKPKDLYGGFILKYRDSDKRRTWGGKKRKFSANHVADLQNHLKEIGVYTGTVDGGYGIATREAVRRLQWNSKNIKRRLKNKSIVQVSRTFISSVSGMLDINTKKELASWINKKHKATGDLIRVKELEFNNIQVGSGFRRIAHPCVSDDDIIISCELLKYLVYADEKARDLSIMLNLNQAMRVSGVRVSGAVVKPASKSQHLIGHAIDCNIIDGNNWNTKKTFKSKKETTKAKKFIKAMKANGMRWGGDFSGNFDPPHFDKKLSSATKDFEYKYFFNQRIISEKHIIPLISW